MYRAAQVPALAGQRGAFYIPTAGGFALEGGGVIRACLPLISSLMVFLHFFVAVFFWLDFGSVEGGRKNL